LADIIFRIIDKIFRWHEEYRKKRLMQSLRYCGKGVSIRPDVTIFGTHNVILNDDVGINSFTHIFGAGGVHIGARTMISACCSITSVTHCEQIADRLVGIESPVIIEEDCWLGTGAIVLPGVRIGRGSIIGAGAVVTKDIPPMSVATGVPARVVRQVVS
jgi:acetyltransferase-like isoleucine patch superfamily enzyme